MMSTPSLTNKMSNWQANQIIAENDFYYRRFIGATTQGYFKVQDFYKSTHHKLTDPFVLINYWACRLNLLALPLEENYFSLWLSGYSSHDIIRLVDLEGSYSVYTENGVRLALFNCKLGKREGVSKTWYENGALAAEACFKNNIRNGHQSYWREDGSCSQQFSYLEGKTHGTYRIFYPSGQLSKQTCYHMGEADGAWTEWHENGNLKSESYYKLGKPVGHWKEWNESAALISETLYESPS